MLILKAEYLQLGQIAKPTVMYAGKLFCKVQDFELSQRSEAEEECRETWKSGKPSLLVECGNRWILYSEGVIPESAPLEPVDVLPAPSADLVLDEPSLSSKAFLNSNSGHIEMRYRGSLMRKPIEAVAQQPTSSESSTIPAPLEQPLVSQSGEKKSPEYIEMRYRGSLIRKPVQS